MLFGAGHVLGAHAENGRNKQALHAGPLDHAGTGKSGVLIAADHAPALARGAFPAEPDLVLDRGGILQVGGIAGVEGDTDGHGRISGSRRGTGSGVVAIPPGGMIGTGGIAGHGADERENLLPMLGRKTRESKHLWREAGHPGSTAGRDGVIGRSLRPVLAPPSGNISPGSRHRPSAPARRRRKGDCRSVSV